MITLAQQRAALKTMFETITALDTVFDYAPRAIQDEELPALIMTPLEAVYDQEQDGGDTLIVNRRWRFRLVAFKAGLGDEFTAEQAADAVIDAVIVKLASYKRLLADNDESFEVFMHEGGDTGLARITDYADADYAGCDFTAFTQVDNCLTIASV